MGHPHPSPHTYGGLVLWVHPAEDLMLALGKGIRKVNLKCEVDDVVLLSVDESDKSQLITYTNILIKNWYFGTRHVLGPTNYRISQQYIT